MQFFLYLVERFWLVFDHNIEQKNCFSPHTWVLHTFNIFIMPQTWGSCQLFCLRFPCFDTTFRGCYVSYSVMLRQLPRNINLSSPLCHLSFTILFFLFLDICKSMTVSLNKSSKYVQKIVHFFWSMQIFFSFLSCISYHLKPAINNTVFTLDRKQRYLFKAISTLFNHQKY